MSVEKDIYELVIEVGPRRIARIGNWPGIYLPKQLMALRGRKALITVKVLRENTKPR